MTEVMNSLEPGSEDFSGADDDATFPDAHERYPKLSKRLPSIVVEPTDVPEVESGELRWPPDEPSSPDAQTQRHSAEGHAADDEGIESNVDEEASAAEMTDSN